MAVFKAKPDSIYDRVLDNLSAAVVLLQRDLTIVYLNSASEILFETSRRKVHGRSIEKLADFPKSLLSRMILSLSAERPFSQHEIELHIGQHKPITVDCTMNPVCEAESQAGLLLEFTRIDRHLRLAAEERLADQQSATETLLTGLSHEIKNPLGGIRGAAQLLAHELSDKQLQEYTSVIISEADRLKNLVDRMLSPGLLPQKKWFNIHEALERVYSLLSVEENDIDIVRDYDPSIPEVYADPEQIIQAVLNLAKNAAEAMQGEGCLVLRSRTQRQFTIASIRYKLVVVLEIIDTGPGIPEEIADKIFFPMVSGRASGTGLGLSIAQSIVSHHGGLIACDSKPGNTVFQIYLPLEAKTKSQKIVLKESVE